MEIKWANIDWTNNTTNTSLKMYSNPNANHWKPKIPYKIEANTKKLQNLQKVTTIYVAISEEPEVYTWIFQHIQKQFFCKFLIVRFKISTEWFKNAEANNKAVLSFFKLLYKMGLAGLLEV